MPTIHPNSANWFRFDEELPRGITIGDDGIYTFASSNQTFSGSTNVEYTGDYNVFTLSCEVVSGNFPQLASVAVYALDSNGTQIGNAILRVPMLDAVMMQCDAIPVSFKLAMNCGLGREEARIKVMLNEGETVMDWTSIYEAGTDSYHVEFYYQQSDGSWPMLSSLSEEREGNIGDTVNLTDEDKQPTRTPFNGRYVYTTDIDVSDTGRYPIESGVLYGDSMTILTAFFKWQVQPKINIYYQASDGSYPSVPSEVHTIDEWVEVGTEYTKENLASMQPTEMPVDGTYIMDMSKLVDTIVTNGNGNNALEVYFSFVNATGEEVVSIEQFNGFVNSQLKTDTMANFCAYMGIPYTPEIVAADGVTIVENRSKVDGNSVHIEVDVNLSDYIAASLGYKAIDIFSIESQYVPKNYTSHNVSFKGETSMIGVDVGVGTDGMVIAEKYDGIFVTAPESVDATIIFDYTI